MTTLLAKPCQSGKTFELLNKTTKLIENNSKAIHIVLTDNSLIQLEQLHTRIENVTNEGVIVLSADYDISNREIQKRLCDNSVKYIILCANMTQINKTDKIIRSMLNVNIRNCQGKTFYIWIDEGDKIAEPANIKVLDKWAEYENVKKICYITATPYSLIVRYGKMNVMKVKFIYNTKTYSKWSDCRVITQKETNNPNLYVKKAFEEKEPYSGQVWFIAPGNLCDTHDDITKFLNRRDFYVLTINVYGEFLTTPSRKEIPLEGKGALSDRISFLYKKYNLKNELFAIVGYSRIGRGITIQSSTVLITHAVFPTTPVSNAITYQLAGRLCGSYKQYSKYKRPWVFCTKEFNKIAFESEEIIIQIAKLMSVDLKKYDQLEEKAEKKYINTRKIK
uniref:Helicase ATP-binding domain-containing protein n=1 Tax=viral metagenome TaxID=1070528 RepID=A0A6C0LIW0_9ZZZZ